MIIKSTAPTRISLFGGGTDLPEYSRQFGGMTISLAINLYQNIIMYTDSDMLDSPHKNQFPFKADPYFYYKILDEFNLNNGVHLTRLITNFDGEIESGIGSSAAAAVAMVGAINRRLGLNMTPEQIAERAWSLEVDVVGLYGGKQDQYAAAMGGVNFLEFNKFGYTKVTPLARGFIEPLLPSLVLFYTGSNRKSPTIQEGFKKLSKTQINALTKIKDLALKSVEPVGNGDIDLVGSLLDQSWELKKESNKGVSTPEIDFIYKRAKKLGALGGKLCGAGGGGYIMFVVPQKKREQFIIKMKKEGLQWWDFSVDWNGINTRVVKP